MGDICSRVTMTASLSLIRLPALTPIAPARPLIGADDFCVGKLQLSLRQASTIGVTGCVGTGNGGFVGIQGG